MKLNFEQPLPDRPGVMVHRKENGQRVVIGDGNPFTPAEHAALSPVIEPKRHDLPFTAGERAELADAETRLAEALRLRALAEERMWAARDKGQTYERGLGFRPGERAVERAEALRAAYGEAKALWKGAVETEGLARREQTAASLRVHQAARMRDLAAEHAETPPLNTPPTLPERMTELIGRLA